MIEKMENEIAKAPKIPQAVPAVKAPPMAKTPIKNIPAVSMKEKKNGSSIFMAVLISVVIIALLSVASWFLVRKYIWQPQQAYMENQFKTVSIKLEEFDSGLKTEKDSIQELLTSIEDLKTEVEGLKEMEVEPTEIEAYMMEEFDIPADWETYTNTDWGIEFQYPADWEVSIDENGNLNAEIIGTKDLFNQVKEKDEESFVGQSVPQPSLNIYTSNLRFLKEKITQDEIINNELEVSEFLLDGKSTRGILILEQGFNAYVLWIEIEKDNYIKSYINHLYPIKNEKKINIIDKTVLNILKTLKFTK
jgi:hypothetical protein